MSIEPKLEMRLAIGDCNIGFQEGLDYMIWRMSPSPESRRADMEEIDSVLYVLSRSPTTSPLIAPYFNPPPFRPMALTQMLSTGNMCSFESE